MANRSSNRAAIPEAKSALDRFKYEVASEIGVPLKDGYNGDLTSRQNGSVGGYMVKKMIEHRKSRWQASNPPVADIPRKRKKYQRKRRDRRLHRSRFMCEIISSSDSVPA